MLRSTILAASRNRRVEELITRAPVSRQVVRRFVGGPDTAAAVEATRGLLDAGLTVTLDHLGEDTTDRDQAAAVVTAYRDLLEALHRASLTGAGGRAPGQADSDGSLPSSLTGAGGRAPGQADPPGSLASSRNMRTGELTARADVSVKLSAIGQALPGDGEKIALEHAREICATAERVGATVTLDMEDHTTTDSTLAILAELRADFPATAAVLQAYLHRTEGDCRDLATAGSRVRLCKGAYREPASVAYQKREDVDLSYVRCTNVLMSGAGYPMLATHDPRLIEIGIERARFHGKHDFELQMLYGIRPNEQRRLAAAGHTVRVYVPYGAEWYGYLMRRLAERPANLTFFARALLSKG